MAEKSPVVPGNPEDIGVSSKASRSSKGYGEARTFTPDNVPLDQMPGNKKQVSVGKSKPSID